MGAGGVDGSLDVALASLSVCGNRDVICAGGLGNIAIALAAAAFTTALISPVRGGSRVRKSFSDLQPPLAVVAEGGVRLLKVLRVPLVAHHGVAHAEAPELLELHERGDVKVEVPA